VGVEDPGQIAPVLFGLWVVLGLVSAGFFLFSKSARLKRLLWPPCVVAAGLLFIAFGVAMGEERDALLLMVPAVVAITLLNLRAVKFCDACGTTIVNRNPLARPEFCSKCGARLAR
jgi:hypothetical protein